MPGEGPAGTAVKLKPNIVIIPADDLGYADLGCRDIPTPHTDLLAVHGVRFTNGCANHPVCSPSRAGLSIGGRILLTIYRTVGKIRGQEFEANF